MINLRLRCLIFSAKNPHFIDRSSEKIALIKLLGGEVVGLFNFRDQNRDKSRPTNPLVESPSGTFLPFRQASMIASELSCLRFLIAAQPVNHQPQEN